MCEDSEGSKPTNFFWCICEQLVYLSDFCCRVVGVAKRKFDEVYAIFVNGVVGEF